MVAKRSKTSKTDRKEKKKPTAPPENDIVELDEAIALLKTSRSTLYRWIRQGRLKALKAGRQWRFRREDLRRFLEGEPTGLALPVSAEPFLEALRTELEKAGASPKETAEMEQGKDAETGDPMRRALRLLLCLGWRLKASDVHVAPHIEASGAIRVAIRLRLTGVLHAVADMDPRLLSHFVETCKQLTGSDVLTTSHPQVGRCTLAIGGEAVTARFSYLPSTIGEAITARFFDRGDLGLTLEDCGYRGETQKRVEEAVHSPNGIVLFTGPCGSGKTTTMLAALQCIDAAVHKVVSIEEAPMTHLPWVNQVALNEDEGIVPSVALRNIMYSDPDVVVAGEIRDPETLEATVRIALTGHLVLGQLHARNAAEALLRLVEMGGSPYEIGEAVKLVVSQRLWRRVCKACSKQGKPVAALRKAFDIVLSEGGVDPKSLKVDFRTAVGCPECWGTGHKGRLAAPEALAVTPAVAAALRNAASLAEIQAMATEEGMVSLQAEIVRNAYSGETSIQEAERIAVG